MGDTCYIFDYSSDRAVLYQRGKYIYPIASDVAEHWVDGDYVFCLKTQKITFWILGEHLYGHIGNGELTREPLYYFGT